MLENDFLYEGRVVGVEKFVNDEPLTLQLQVNSNASHEYVYNTINILFIEKW